jgi:hypothetical protein
VESEKTSTAKKARNDLFRVLESLNES